MSYLYDLDAVAESLRYRKKAVSALFPCPNLTADLPGKHMLPPLPRRLLRDATAKRCSTGKIVLAQCLEKRFGRGFELSSRMGKTDFLKNRKNSV